MNEYREHRERNKRRQLTITLEEGLASWLRETASENGVPVSTVVEVALARDKERRKAALGVTVQRVEGGRGERAL